METFHCSAPISPFNFLEYLTTCVFSGFLSRFVHSSFILALCTLPPPVWNTKSLKNQLDSIYFIFYTFNIFYIFSYFIFSILDLIWNFLWTVQFSCEAKGKPILWQFVFFATGKIFGWKTVGKFIFLCDTGRKWRTVFLLLRQTSSILTTPTFSHSGPVGWGWDHNKEDEITRRIRSWQVKCEIMTRRIRSQQGGWDHDKEDEITWEKGEQFLSTCHTLQLSCILYHALYLIWCESGKMPNVMLFWPLQWVFLFAIFLLAFFICPLQWQWCLEDNLCIAGQEGA